MPMNGHDVLPLRYGEACVSDKRGAVAAQELRELVGRLCCSEKDRRRQLLAGGALSYVLHSFHQSVEAIVYGQGPANGCVLQLAVSKASIKWELSFSLRHGRCIIDVLLLDVS
jgi:hypothetical protein